MYSIGEIISTYRKKKGLLQQDLADELAKEGITISYKAISNWERNLAEPSVTIFYKVCRILGITNMYEAYFGVNPADPFSSLTDEGIFKNINASEWNYLSSLLFIHSGCVEQIDIIHSFFPAFISK